MDIPDKARPQAAVNAEDRIQVLWRIGGLVLALSLLGWMVAIAIDGPGDRGLSGPEALLVLAQVVGWICVLVAAAATSTRLGMKSLDRR